MALPNRRLHLFLFFALSVLLLAASVAFAQEEAAAAESPETIMEMILKSGASGIAFMVILGSFSLIAVAVIIERLVNQARSKLLPPDFVSELQQLSRGSGDVERFRPLAGKSQAPIARVLRAALLRTGRPLVEVEKAMEDALAREAATLRGRVRPLNVIASVAPLVGLLGTVVGMIMSFRTASQAGLGRAEILAEGIYLALLTTAAGLIIAVPAVLAGAYFNAQIDRTMHQTDEYLMETIPAFGRAEQRETAADRATDQLVAAGRD
ncbi:MAG: MotA/TolQ/ExbB proton channel family protein [Planctomycetes bacterium]|nr:MotA/TolQ/ExbB proton channel family protein [Planctomycetota bacterium]